LMMSMISWETPWATASGLVSGPLELAVELTRRSEDG
jgi:hypothetical protein